MNALKKHEPRSVGPCIVRKIRHAMVGEEAKLVNEVAAEIADAILRLRPHQPGTSVPPVTRSTGFHRFDRTGGDLSATFWNAADCRNQAMKNTGFFVTLRGPPFRGEPGRESKSVFVRKFCPRRCKDVVANAVSADGNKTIFDHSENSQQPVRTS